MGACRGPPYEHFGPPQKEAIRYAREIVGFVRFEMARLGSDLDVVVNEWEKLRGRFKETVSRETVWVYERTP